MSTSALLAYKDENNTYFINSVNFDGYIKNGVGDTLRDCWSGDEREQEEILELVQANPIRSLGPDFPSTEFYPSRSTFMKKREGLNWEELTNMAGNFNYTYVFEDGEWQLLSDRGILEMF